MRWLELNKFGVWWCDWDVLEVVVEGAVGDVGGEGREGVLRGERAGVGDIVIGGVPPFLRSTYSFVLFPLGSHIRLVSASWRARTSSTVQASQPSWSRSATWSRISAIRLAMAFSSQRPSNGSGSRGSCPESA